MKIIFLLLLMGIVTFFVLRVYKLINLPDSWCTTIHKVTSQAPSNPQTPDDFFALGNYNYDTGNCIQAIAAYSQAIEANPNFPRAYNNRAYTYMRLQRYKDALSDLNMAISIDPDYVTALMNRGDIYNYYYEIDRQKALADYGKVVALGQNKDRSGSVCGHIAMAKTSNLIPLALLRVATNIDCTSN